ncbi:MAG: hypothetical protein MZW92_11385 [Comamonadaceae bacterium]|nr:hypothetical protein [Comamonadaceae bacterium]
MRYNDGYALFVLPPWRVEISLNLLLLLMVGGFALLYLLLRLVVRTLRMPQAGAPVPRPQAPRKGCRLVPRILAPAVRGPLRSGTEVRRAGGPGRRVAGTGGTGGGARGARHERRQARSAVAGTRPAA